jgi:hypothetical protein
MVISRSLGKNGSTIAFVLAKDGPRQANQLIGQGHDDHTLVRATQKLR